MHHLLTHTSGYYDVDVIPTVELAMVDGTFPPEVDETQSLLMQRILDVVYRTAPRRKPGERNVYCTPGIVLVAEVVRRLSGMRFADFVKQRVFEPLGMTSTFLELPETEDHRVVLRSPSDGYPEEFWSLPSMRNAMGAGGGVSNTIDLGVFCQTFLNGGRYG